MHVLCLSLAELSWHVKVRCYLPLLVISVISGSNLGHGDLKADFSLLMLWGSSHVLCPSFTV